MSSEVRLQEANMSRTAIEVGRRIRVRRQARGWTQAELAHRLGRTQTAVSYWESGQRSMSIDDLVDVADVLGVDSAKLLPPQQTRQPPSALLRAFGEQIAADQLADQLTRFGVRAQDAAPLGLLWDIAPASPRDVADTLLEAADVQAPPVPIDELAAGCGVRVIHWNFDDIAGLLLEHHSGAVIGVNLRLERTRQRLTLAHELGHHLLRHADDVYLDLTGDLSPNVTGGHPGYDWGAEQAATQFAANLLMPSRMVRREAAEHVGVGALAEVFDVNPTVMAIRLATLGLG
jgi:transcriptional regulator with XRE-family HTH domain